MQIVGVKHHCMLLFTLQSVDDVSYCHGVSRIKVGGGLVKRARTLNSRCRIRLSVRGREQRFGEIPHPMTVATIMLAQGSFFSGIRPIGGSGVST